MSHLPRAGQYHKERLGKRIVGFGAGESALVKQYEKFFEFEKGFGGRLPTVRF